MSATIGRGGKGSPPGAAGTPGKAARGSSQHAEDHKDRARGAGHQDGKAISNVFTRFSSATATVVGTPWSFLLALGIVIVWAVTGPLFGFSDTWQLVINTGTTIVTFLMVFLIQNTQNRDAKALHLKLDELLRAIEDARHDVIDIEEANEEDLERLQRRYRELRQSAEGSDEQRDAA